MRQSKLVEHAKKIISQEYRFIKGVDEVAQEINVPFETLRKAFVRKENITLSQYLRIVRIEQAKLMLSKTRKTCYEVCCEVGFGREDVGARTFKRETGMTMNQFRLVQSKVSKCQCDSLRNGGDRMCDLQASESRADIFVGSDQEKVRWPRARTQSRLRTGSRKGDN